MNKFVDKVTFATLIWTFGLEHWMLSNKIVQGYADFPPLSKLIVIKNEDTYVTIRNELRSVGMLEYLPIYFALFCCLPSWCRCRRMMSCIVCWMRSVFFPRILVLFHHSNLLVLRKVKKGNTKILFRFEFYTILHNTACPSKN